ncbi:MAG: hypothetical protein M3Y07_07420 [Acidobacteriota bacterium]|nr:hypothetical protein [Acidobacteriota bacterium]
MSKGFAIAFGVGLLLIGAAAWSLLYSTKGAHLVPQGSILKVRTQKADDATSVMVVDFRLTNNAEYPMVIRKADLTVERADGTTAEGLAMASADVKKLFGYYRLLGEQFNEVLKFRDEIPPRKTVDRMMAFQLDLPYANLEARKKIVMRIEDITGPAVELSAR